jgi:hypothetical protein
MGMTVAYAVIDGFLLGRAEGIVKNVEDEGDKITLTMIAKNGKYVVMSFEKPVRKLGGGYDLEEIRKLNFVGKRCIAHLIKQNRIDRFYIVDENGKKTKIPKIKA